VIEITQYEEVTQIRMSRELEGRPVYWVAAYLVDGLLIDTGCSHTAKELAAFLEDKDLRQVVNTHYHEDHMGGNHDLMSRPELELYAHPDSIPLIANRFDLYPYQEIAWGYPIPTTVKPIPSILETEIFSFQVLNTPGHCAGHICPTEISKGWCFTGDLFARERPKFIRPEENIGEIIQSMHRVIELPVDRLVLFTAVGKIIEDGRKALSECIGYLMDLTARIKEMVQAGSTLDDIVKDIFGGEHPFSELTNGQFSTYNLVRSLRDTVS
jgi:glyoxylase-like metal-dependent hydrolase (beta-lactamase superfamily II)